MAGDIRTALYFFRYKAIVLAVRGRRTDSTRPLNRWYNGLALTSQF